MPNFLQRALAQTRNFFTSNAPAPGDDRLRHVFVLMLENRSYDNLFGNSGFVGHPPGDPNSKAFADDLTQDEQGKTRAVPFQNATRSGQAYPVVQSNEGAPYFLARRDGDPGHEFTDTIFQLCGADRDGRPTADEAQNDKHQLAGGPYPDVVDPDRRGFAASYQDHGALNPDSVLRAFVPGQLPVLHQLAREFAVCDRWFSSLPGPTWPNRFFALMGSSAGLDHSPTNLEAAFSGGLGTFSYGMYHWSIFGRLDWVNRKWLVASGDNTPQCLAIKGMHEHSEGRRVKLKDLYRMLAKGSLDASFVFIEPSYDVLGNYRRGSSMHPLGDVREGEKLVKEVYEAIRQSIYWPDSLLVIAFDEHGGFFDHVTPPQPATPPGDAFIQAEHNQHGFRFDAYGVRVPAIVVSPWVERGVVDHTLYDHTSILKTLDNLFKLSDKSEATNRVKQANSLMGLLRLSKGGARIGRNDAPWTLEEPVQIDAAAQADASNVQPPETLTRSMKAFAAIAHQVRLQGMKDDVERQTHLDRAKTLTNEKDLQAFAVETLRAVR